MAGEFRYKLYQIWIVKQVKTSKHPEYKIYYIFMSFKKQARIGKKYCVILFTSSCVIIRK